MGLRLSASQLGQALHCGYAYRNDVEVVPDLVGKSAYTGQLFASLRENFFHPEREIRVPKRADEKAAKRWFDKWLIWWKTYESKHPKVKWFSEVPFALEDDSNVAFHRARILPVSEHREYATLTKQEIPGTADIVGVGPDYVVILDDKTGAVDNVEPAATNLQLKFLATAATLHYNKKKSVVGLVFPREERVLDEARDVHDIRAFAGIRDEIANSQPVIGDHCWKCPLRYGGCPKYQQIDALFGTYSPKAASRTLVNFMRKRKAKTTSQDVVARDKKSDDPADNEFAPGQAIREYDRPVYHPDFGRIIERIYSVDVKAEYDRLEESLKIGEKRGDRGTLAKSVDEAESNARTAHEIYLCAIRERARWEAEAEVVMSPLRKQANEALQALKADGLHSKIITDADVRAKMAAQHPEEFKWHEEHLAKIKGLEEATKKMSELWTSRCASVRLMYDKAR